MTQERPQNQSEQEWWHELGQPDPHSVLLNELVQATDRFNDNIPAESTQNNHTADLKHSEVAQWIGQQLGYK